MYWQGQRPMQFMFIQIMAISHARCMHSPSPNRSHKKCLLIYSPWKVHKMCSRQMLVIRWTILYLICAYSHIYDHLYILWRKRIISILAVGTRQHEQAFTGQFVHSLIRFMRIFSMVHAMNWQHSWYDKFTTMAGLKPSSHWGILSFISMRTRECPCIFFHVGNVLCAPCKNMKTAIQNRARRLGVCRHVQAIQHGHHTAKQRAGFENEPA